jgi:hypothetical protein
LRPIKLGLVKIFLYVIAEGLVQTGSIEAVSIEAVLV